MAYVNFILFTIKIFKIVSENRMNHLKIKKYE